jgi:[ribosomal protein S5]-alanine N-acetyltransferase
VGYWVGESVWGKGLATSALRQFVQWGFEEFGLRRFFATTMVDNLASRRVLEKVGFQLEGILRQHVVKEGVVHNQAYYGLIRSELITSS